MVKSFEVTELPGVGTISCTLPYSLLVIPFSVRTAKFIARKQWIICGSDDNQLRVYNYNTLEKVKVWEAHADYIR